MASPNAPVTTTPASFSQLLAQPIPPFVPGVLNAQHEYHAALEQVRDAVVDAIWQADSEAYIAVTDALPGFTGSNYADVKAHVAAMLDAGKFAEIDEIMERLDEAESNYDPGDDEDEDEEADENDGE